MELIPDFKFEPALSKNSSRSFHSTNEQSRKTLKISESEDRLVEILECKTVLFEGLSRKDPSVEKLFDRNSARKIDILCMQFQNAWNLFHVIYLKWKAP